MFALILDDGTETVLGRFQDLRCDSHEGSHASFTLTNGDGSEELSALLTLSHRQLRNAEIDVSLSALTSDDQLLMSVTSGIVGSIQAAKGDGDKISRLSIELPNLDPLLPSAEIILRTWIVKRPSEINTWASATRQERLGWLQLTRRLQRIPQVSIGRYVIDGQYVDDLPSFYLAFGEAMNGPAGYFGHSFGAITDCLRGGFGPVPPFQLELVDCEFFETHKLLSQERDKEAPHLPTLSQFLTLVTKKGVSVLLPSGETWPA